MILHSNNSVRRCRPFLGTFVEITAWGDNAALEAAVETAYQAIQRVHRLMSFHDSSSELSRLNREAAQHTMTVDPWLFEVLTMAREIAAASDGAFDPTIAPILQRWGLLPSDSSSRCQMESAHWDDLELGPRCQVRFACPLTLDLGGIAKGFAVDCAVEALREAGVEFGLVNAGGDLRAFGDREQIVQVRHPKSPGRRSHELRLREAAFATSAPIFSRCETSDGVVSHLVNPVNGLAQVADLSVSVRAPKGMLADALTKVVLFGGDIAESVLAEYHAQAFVISDVEKIPTSAVRGP